MKRRGQQSRLAAARSRRPAPCTRPLPEIEAAGDRSAETPAIGDAGTVVEPGRPAGGAPARSRAASSKPTSHRLRPRSTPRRLAATTIAVFVLSMLIVTGVELFVLGRPLSGGSGATTVGNAVAGVLGNPPATRQ